MNYSIPPEYKPISSWGYVGYNLLYAIPIIGFIALVFNAVGAKNLNVRFHARSFFCGLLIVLLIAVVVWILINMGYIKIDISVVEDVIKFGNA